MNSGLNTTNPSARERTAPLFSVITVVYNAADTIRETIESVLRQGFSDYEYILVDGGSNDGTLDILHEYRSHFSRLVSEADNGIYHAMNKGLCLAAGYYVHYLNANDVYASGSVLAQIASSIDTCSEPPAVITGAVRMDYGDYHVTRRGDLTRLNLRHAVMPAHQGVFTRRTALRQVSGFDTRYRTAADFDLLCRLLHGNPRIVNTGICVARMQAGGVSANKRITYSEKAKLLRYHFGFLPAARYHFCKRILEQGAKWLLQHLLPNRAFVSLNRQYNRIQV